jgi:4-hydroxy-tetrahydrodipicolinate reductase
MSNSMAPGPSASIPPGGGMRITVHGATGRMGRAVVRAARDARDMVVGAVAAPDAPEHGRDVGEVAGVGNLGVAITPHISEGLLGADVVIDFSIASAVPPLVKAAERARIPIVSGTTGLDAAARGSLEEAARVIPVLWAPNMSFGVELLAALAKLAAERLGGDYDIEIVETHHRMKVDAPSGTALRLAEAVKEARGDLAAVHGRQGAPGPRKRNEIGILAMRGGDVLGDHQIHFLGPSERFELTHRATDRDLFARGAVRAARWLVGRPPGRYTLADLLR